MTADERINALIERAGSPVMIVKGKDKYSPSARMAQIDKQARMMAHELHSQKYECTISIMGDEIIAQDAKIRDMANIINRMEAALHNVLNERDQLLDDLGEIVFYMNVKSDACEYCKHMTDPGAECWHSDACHFEWRGVPDKEDAK